MDDNSLHNQAAELSPNRDSLEATSKVPGQFWFVREESDRERFQKVVAAQTVGDAHVDAEGSAPAWRGTR